MCRQRTVLECKRKHRRISTFPVGYSQLISYAKFFLHNGFRIVLERVDDRDPIKVKVASNVSYVKQGRPAMFPCISILILNNVTYRSFTHRIIS
jgi:hypothetical protein